MEQFAQSSELHIESIERITLFEIVRHVDSGGCGVVGQYLMVFGLVRLGR